MYATIDIESTGLDRYKEEITFIGVGLAKNVGEPIYKYFFYDMSDPEDVTKFRNLCKNLRERKVKTVFQGGKFDTLFIELKEDIKLPISEDILLMGTAYDLAANHALKTKGKEKGMAERYLGVSNWDISTKEKTSRDKKKVIPYLKLDVKYTWELFCFFYEELSPIQWKHYRKLLKPAYLMYRDAERLGIYFDRKEYKVVKAKYKKLEAEKLAELKKKYDINWNSPQQKAKILFTDKNGERLPVIKKSKKTGAPSADAEVCKKLAVQGYTLPILLSEYTDANTLNKMFLNRWGDDSSYDGRIHPNFGLFNVRSGRTSCSNPNLQQVPRKKDVRSLFHTTKGKVFFEADYSQLELRIAADYANELTMLNIYKNHGDIHTETAKTLTNGREPTKEERGAAKAVNFGFIYGMFAKGFVDYAFNSYGVVFTLNEAKHYRDLFFAKYPRLLPWHEEQKEMARALGGVSNKFGRFRKLPDIYSDNWSLRGSAERISLNTPVQGTGSDILLSAAIEIHQEYKNEGVSIVGTVHDSILGECWEDDVEWVVPEIRRIMTKPKLLDEFGVHLKVELECDIGVGKWGTH
jgi:DNA polymerase-1